MGFRRFPLQIVKRAQSAFDGDDWQFEIKHDGFRVLAIRDGERTRLYTRNGHDISRRHPQITAALIALPAERFVIDGELVVLDDDGRSNFAKLARARTGTHYYAFDLLRLGATDLRSRHLEARKAKLTKLLEGCADSVRLCDNIIGQGKDFFELVRKAGLEGMVAKRRHSKCVGALTGDWLKVKCLRVHDFVIGGWLESDAKKPQALLLGEFIGGRLCHVGQVGTHSDAHLMNGVARLLTPQAASPFIDAVTDERAKFCEPEFRTSVEFVEFTDDGYLRNPSFRRFSDELVRPI